MRSGKTTHTNAKDEAAPSAEKKEAAPAQKKEEAAKVDAAKATPAGDEEWKDNTYKCIDCSEDWADTAEDQEWRFNQGFAETPKRCKDCRWAKKVRMEGGDPTAKGKGKGKKGKKGKAPSEAFAKSTGAMVESTGKKT